METSAGVFWFLESDFRAIVPGGCPEREWPSRRDAALKQGGPVRLAAAWWALENGLTSESAAMVRAARESDPKHPPAARLAAALDALAAPCSDPDTTALSRALKVPCQTVRSAHVLLIHDHEPAVAEARVDVLERVTTSFYLLLAAEGIELPVPAQRLVAVYLRNQTDYLSFLHSQNAGAFRTTLGYYHPTLHAVIAFDPRSCGKSRATLAALDRPRRRMLNSGGRDESRGDPGAPFVELADPQFRDLLRRYLLFEMEETARDLGTAAHEMVHLLVDRSGLSRHPGQFPQWFHEGFAAQFEVVRGGRWSGFGRAHDVRLADWRSMTHPPELTSLVRDAGFGHGYRRDLYAESWSLVYFLRKTRPRESTRFLEILRLPAADDNYGQPARVMNAFVDAFGSNLSAIAKEWLQFSNGVRTPLQDSAPPAANRGTETASRQGFSRS